MKYPEELNIGWACLRRTLKYTGTDKLVLWTLAGFSGTQHVETLLKSEEVRHVALANPEARLPMDWQPWKCLDHFGIYETGERTNWSIGESIAQTNQFVISQGGRDRIHCPFCGAKPPIFRSPGNVGWNWTPDTYQANRTR